MIETSQWRARIGQFGARSHHVVSVSQSLYHWDRVSTDAHLSPVCALVIAVALLMSGDIESNPGPNGKKGTLAKHILQMHIVTITQVVKSNLVHFNNRLQEELLIPARWYNPDNKTMTNEQLAVALYSACMTAVEIDLSKYSTVVKILSEYSLLERTVQEMTAEGIKAGLIEEKSHTMPQSKEGALSSQRGVDIDEPMLSQQAVIGRRKILYIVFVILFLLIVIFFFISNLTITII